MHTVGDEYGIPLLCEYAIQRVQEITNRVTAEEIEWTDDDVTHLENAIKIAFTETLDSNRGMRDAIASLLKCDFRRLLKTKLPAFLQSNTPELTTKVLCDLAEEEPHCDGCACDADNGDVRW